MEVLYKAATGRYCGLRDPSSGHACQKLSRLLPCAHWGAQCRIAGLPRGTAKAAADDVDALPDWSNCHETMVSRTLSVLLQLCSG
jgi:hypothetical protein